MATSRIHARWNTSLAASNSAYVFPSSGQAVGSNLTQAQGKLTFRTAGTITKLGANKTAGDRTSMACAVNVGNVDGSGALAFTSTNGWYDDVSGSDSISAGNDVAFHVSGGTGGTTSLLLKDICANWAATSDTTTHLAANIGVATASATTYSVPGGTGSAQSTQTQGEWLVKVPGGGSVTIKNLFVNPYGNARSATTVSVNGATGAGTAPNVSIPNTSTAIVEDTTNSIVANDGDKISIKVVTGVGTGTLNMNVSIEVESSSGVWFLVWSGGNVALGTAVKYVDTSGGGTDTTESNVSIKMQTTDTAKLLSVNVQTAGTGSSIGFRANNADAGSPSTMSVATTSTGWTTDSTNSYTPAASDQVNFVSPACTAGATINCIAVTFSAQLAAALAGTTAGIGAATGSLTTAIRLNGATAGTGAASGALTTVIRLAGTTAGVGTATAGITDLVGTSVGTATVSGRLQSDFATTSAGVGILVGRLQSDLAGSAVGVGAMSANLRIGVTLTGTADGHALVFGRLYPQGAGTPLEVDVYDGSTGAMLATLDGAVDRSYLDALSDIGSFSFRIRVSDPKAQYVVRGNIVKFRLHGQYRFAGVIESPSTVVAAPNGAADEIITAQGRGATALLDWAKQAPGAGSYGTIPAGAVLATAIAAAKARGLLSLLSYDFTASVDSAGAMWTDAAPYTVNDGDTYLNIWRLLTAIGIETRVDPTTLTLQAFQTPIGSDISSGVVVEQRRHVRDTVTRAADDTQYFSRVWVKGKSGSVVQVLGDESDHRRAPREGYLEVTSTDDPATLTLAGQTALADAANIAKALHVPMLHGLGPGELEPYLDFGNGDTVLVNLDGVSYESSRVKALQITDQDNDGRFEIDADFNAVALEAVARMKAKLDELYAKAL